MTSEQRIADRSIDVTGACHVEILVKEDGKVVWVNVDGACVLRVCRIVHGITINDKRKKRKKQ